MRILRCARWEGWCYTPLSEGGANPGGEDKTPGGKGVAAMLKATGTG